LRKDLSFKNINRLAIPALIAGIAEPVISITDAAIVGNIPVNGTEALAAVGIVGSFLSALIWILGQTRSAISAIISQYLGAGRLDELRTLPAQAIFLNVLLSIFILFSTIFFVEGIFKLYNATGLYLNTVLTITTSGFGDFHLRCLLLLFLEFSEVCKIRFGQ
jgi:multidrug resistance protein, MATE family